MGYNSEASTLTLTAVFTAFGREQLLKGKANLITHFSFSDGKANYYAANELMTGEVPAIAGKIGANGGTSNSAALGYASKDFVVVDALGNKKKRVNVGSDKVTVSVENLSQVTIDSNEMTYDKVDRTDTETDSKVNLFRAFNLPINAADDALFNTTPTAAGGYSDTALADFGVDEVLIIGLDSSKLAEMVDGKSFNLNLIATGGTGSTTAYTVYSTFEKTLTNSKVQDARYKEHSFNGALFGANIAFLFSDQIQEPNADAANSWATGYGTNKPFGVGRKHQFNMFTDAITAINADDAIGILYLDSGFAVINEPEIVDAFITSGATGVTANTAVMESVSTKVVQEVVCIKERGEFGRSTNPTWHEGDAIRVTEVLLLDEANNIIAVGSFDMAKVFNNNEFFSVAVKLVV